MLDIISLSPSLSVSGHRWLMSACARLGRTNLACHVRRAAAAASYAILDVLEADTRHSRREDLHCMPIVAAPPQMRAVDWVIL